MTFKQTQSFELLSSLLHEQWVLQALVVLVINASNTIFHP
jgi:hypothetical protein